MVSLWQGVRGMCPRTLKPMRAGQWEGLGQLLPSIQLSSVVLKGSPEGFPLAGRARGWNSRAETLVWRAPRSFPELIYSYTSAEAQSRFRPKQSLPGAVWHCPAGFASQRSTLLYIFPMEDRLFAWPSSRIAVNTSVHLTRRKRGSSLAVTAAAQFISCRSGCSGARHVAARCLSHAIIQLAEFSNISCELMERTPRVRRA